MGFFRARGILGGTVSIIVGAILVIAGFYVGLFNEGWAAVIVGIILIGWGIFLVRINK